MTQFGSSAAIGMIGLGVMGGNLALNIAENGFHVAAYDRNADAVARVVSAASELPGMVQGCGCLAEMVATLPQPRAFIILVPAGQIVDQILDEIAPQLDAGDILIDAGNTEFRDTQRRAEAMRAQQLHYIGMGVSGGEEGARHGPALMIGGEEVAFRQVQPIVQAIAARFEGTPCADWVGKNGAGHFVKTIHNGIEYGDMQLLAEVYGLMRGPMGLCLQDITAVYEKWRTGPLASYLMDVTASVLMTTDPESGNPIVDMIEDQAGQKGTGRWTVVEALHLGQSATIIEAALAARAVSSQKRQRLYAAQSMRHPEPPTFVGISQPTMEQFAKALLSARILAYSQGFSILQAGSEQYDWQLQMDRIAKIWRAGCIIRSALLDDIAKAFGAGVPHDLLMFAPQFHDALMEGLPALRHVVAYAALSGTPVPALSAALTYLEGMCQARGTGNIIQAQRDFFGAHGFARVDQEGTFHGNWPPLTE